MLEGLAASKAAAVERLATWRKKVILGLLPTVHPSTAGKASTVDLQLVLHRLPPEPACDHDNGSVAQGHLVFSWDSDLGRLLVVPAARSETRSSLCSRAGQDTGKTRNDALAVVFETLDS